VAVNKPLIVPDFYDVTFLCFMQQAAADLAGMTV
jgi:hypothetical protein